MDNVYHHQPVLYVAKGAHHGLSFEWVSLAAERHEQGEISINFLLSLARRSIASSSVDGVCAMLNHAVTLVETQLAEGFRQTLRKGFPAQGYLDLSQVGWLLVIFL